MKNAPAITTLFAMFIASAFSQSQPMPVTHDKDLSVPAKPRYIFRIPVFSGTELFRSNPDLAELSPPFGTMVEVFRTTDGLPVDKEAVIAFFRDALEHNGWKEGIFKRQKDEPYLSMRTDVFEALPGGTRIQIAGDFYLWVAPRDGMITVYLHQWRISSMDQATYNSLQAMVSRLMQAAPKAGYRVQKVYSDCGWVTDFENEYLVDRALYSLIPGEAPPRDVPGSIDGPEGTLLVRFLTYRDADVAAGERARREKEFLEMKFVSYRFNAAVKGKTVVTVEGDATKEKTASILSAVTLP